jgi:hypothetical protein
MTTIKMAAVSFACLAAAVMHSGSAGAEPGKETQGSIGAEDENTAEVAPLSASSCSGTRIEHIPMRSGSTIYAYLDVYYDSSTDDNCAMTVGNGAAYGHATEIDVCLARCTQTSPGATCTPDAEPCDPGAYHSYAGPVIVHAPGRCISAAGYLIYDGIFVSGQLPGATHCG